MWFLFVVAVALHENEHATNVTFHLEQRSMQTIASNPFTLPYHHDFVYDPMPLPQVPVRSGGG